jgi:hypothetical protein
MFVAYVIVSVVLLVLTCLVCGAGKRADEARLRALMEMLENQKKGQ